MVDRRNPEAWAACDNGELTELSRRLSTQHARKSQTRFAGGVLAAAVAILAVAYLPNLQSHALHSISCSQCVSMMPAYQQQLAGLEPMPANEREAFENHLESCSKCYDHYHENFSADTPADNAIGWNDAWTLESATRG